MYRYIIKKSIRHIFFYGFVQYASMTNLWSSDTPLNVLCIDGGGVRGIIPAVFLQEIEKRVGRSINEFFDVFAGTSSGGLLATACSLKGSDEDLPSALINFYKEESRKIFDCSCSFKCFSLFKKNKYSRDNLKAAFLNAFGNKTLKDVQKRLFITAVNEKTQKLVIFDSKNKEHHPHRLVDLCLATNAMPTYFPSVTLGGESYVDGGMLANNPSLEIFLRLKQEYPNRQINIISLGAGIARNLYSYDCGILKRMSLNWITPTINMLFSAQSDSADKSLEQFACAANMKLSYHRLQVQLDGTPLEIDITSEMHLQALEKDARKYATTDELGVDIMKKIVRTLNQTHELFNHSTPS
ncbi:MAG: hypothetical protein NEHIOOID_01041 [Holosporales bacterium]